VADHSLGFARFAFQFAATVWAESGFIFLWAAVNKGEGFATSCIPVAIIVLRPLA